MKIRVARKVLLNAVRGRPARTSTLVRAISRLQPFYGQLLWMYQKGGPWRVLGYRILRALAEE